MCRSTCRKFTSARWPLAIAVLAALAAVAPPAALGQDFVQLSAGPIYSSPLVVGQTGVAATFRITNQSSGAVSINTASTDHKIRYVPSCRSTANLGSSSGTLMCQGADQDAGVFAVSGTGNGTFSGTPGPVPGCDNTTFTFSATADAAGTIEISSSANIQLPVGASCNIAFTIDVLKVPTKDASGAAGVQTLGLGNVDPVDGAVLISNPIITGGGTGSTVTTVYACPPGGACCPDGYFSPLTTLCRPSAGPCDVAESCTGDSNLCPPDTFMAQTTICRASGGVCDVPESCTGAGPLCPPDDFQASTTVCRPAAGRCDRAESCTGAGPLCPPDAFRPETTICREAAGVCDVAESCTGTGPFCPPNGFVSATTQCRASAGICDVAESCTGSDASCPSDGFANATTQCRASGGICDVAESCTGGAAECPPDGFANATTQCRASSGICDVAESCTGGGAECPPDGFANATTQCRASGGICDVAESCTGGAAECPPDSFANATTQCRASAGVCDVEESCTGADANCPPDGFQPSTTSCNAELCQSCTGNSASCPTDDLCHPEVCRTPGFWATHAGTEKDRSVNITGLVIASVGQLTVCGQVINNTDLSSIMSAEEALCVSVQGNLQLQLARQLTAAALNCVVSGRQADCSNDPLYEQVFAACNTGPVCAPTTNLNKAAQGACVAALDCLNNGGHPGVDGAGKFLCASGTCSDNGGLCTPFNKSNCAAPDTAVCNPSPNCHIEPLPGYEPPGPAGSSDKCNAARGNSCTIFSCP